MGLFGKTTDVLVVDTSAVLKNKGVRGGPAPRQQLQILRSLSRLVQREKFKVTAVLVGEPLDKAPHNKVFEGVRVRYAKSEELRTKELLSALKQAGSAGVLVAEDVPLENRVIRSGGTTLRVSTFRKLLDDGGEQGDSPAGGNGGGGNGGNRQQRNRRDRGPRNRNPQPQQQQQQQQQQRPAQQEESSERKSNSDAISQMIDLVE